MKSATQQFIEDAIAGGWRWKDGTVDMTDFVFDEYEGLAPEKILLDPLAWQAVGKTREWPDKYQRAIKGNKVVGVVLPWSSYWHDFIHHLHHGKTIEEALAAIQDGV